ncbi:MAG: ribonucleoside triphosphate reductase, partial [archaeon]
MVSAKFVEDLINKKNWKILENSNISYSFSNVFFRVGGEEISRYVLRKIYPKNVSKAHLDGTIHIHNLYMGITGYCAGWSLENILYRGLVGRGSRIVSIPPKHLRTAVHHLVNFVGIIQNEWSGAQAFNSLDTILAPYIAKDKLEYKEVKQCLQEFIYGLNVTNRWGGQSPFTNVTLDFSVPKDMENKETLLGNGVYGDFSNEIEIFNRAFLEIMLEGDPTGKPFTFPIPTYNITKDFPWESENSKLLFKVTGKYGLPYFSNFINSDLKPSDIRSMCCHLRLDLRQLKRNITGGLFGSGDQTGSIGVVTINMPRIGYLSKGEEDFLERLEDIMEIAYLSLEIKRKKVKEGFEKGLFPYSNVYLGTLDNHFSTIGLVGMNEACE